MHMYLNVLLFEYLKKKMLLICNKGIKFKFQHLKEIEDKILESLAWQTVSLNLCFMGIIYLYIHICLILQ